MALSGVSPRRRGIATALKERTVPESASISRVIAKTLAMGLLATLMGGFLVAFTPERALASPTGEICPSSAKTRSTTGTWVSGLGTFNDAGYSAETGTLAGCASAVEVAGPNKTDYYVFFDAASVSGKDLFSAEGIMSLTVTGAPGASGWYIQALDTTAPSAPLSKIYGGGSGVSTDGRANYGHDVTLPDRSISTQPSNTGLASNPSPTYSITYGYSLSASEQASIEAGNLAIYIGFLGSTSTTGAKDIVTTVKLNYFVPETEAGQASEEPSDPGIFLVVAGHIGRHQDNSPVYFGADSGLPSSRFTVTAVPLDRLQARAVVLASGELSPQGHVKGVAQLGPATLAPGRYNVTMSGKSRDGLTLSLTSEITIGLQGHFTSIGANIPRIS